MAALEQVAKPTRKVKVKPYKGRFPSRLVLLLQTNFRDTVTTLEPEELNAILNYFKILRDLKEFNKELRLLDEKLRAFFKIIES